MTLINISDKVFRDSEIQIDGYRFINCRFLNCTLVVYRGAFEFQLCHKTGGTVVFTGEALKCFQLREQDDSVFSLGGDSAIAPESGRATDKPGRLIQFYLLLFLMTLATLAFLLITMNSSDPFIHYGGPVIAGHIFVALIIFAIYHYFFLQKPSPGEEKNSPVKRDSRM